MASAVSAVAVVVTAELSRTAVWAAAVWAAAAFPVLQMYLSYGLLSWSPRAGTLAASAQLSPRVFDANCGVAA